jgi:hypothetical protein
MGGYCKEPSASRSGSLDEPLCINLIEHLKAKAANGIDYANLKSGHVVWCRSANH